MDAQLAVTFSVFVFFSGREKKERLIADSCMQREFKCAGFKLAVDTYAISKAQPPAAEEKVFFLPPLWIAQEKDGFSERQ